MEPNRSRPKFEKMPWTEEVRNHIIKRRAAMSGQLFFDMLLNIGGIENPASVYPPHNMLSLDRLIDVILELSYDSMKRDCLIYYLIKQLQEGKEVRYGEERAIHPHYLAIMDAYWELDSGINLEGAVSRLADVRIVRVYTSKIMDTLALDPNSAFLIRKYVRTSMPPMTELKDQERYAVTLAEHSIMDAWKYQRSFLPNHARRKALLRKILGWALTPKPKAHAIKQMLAIPFVNFEEAFLQDYATNPPEGLPSSAIEAARGLVVVRLIQACKFAAALRFDRQYPKNPLATRGTWAAERERVGREILTVIHRSERDKISNEIAALDADARIRSSVGANVSVNRPLARSSFGTTSSGSADLGGSWEDLGRQAPRSSFSGRIRTSLVNGSPGKQPARASTASPLSKQAPSGQPSAASQNGAGAKSLPLAGAAVNSPLSAARLHAQKTSISLSPVVNGAANGSQKAAAARNRNAFFEVEESRSPSPVPLSAQDSGAVPNASPRHAQTSSAPLPTPPQEEADKSEEERNDENEADGHEEAASEDNAGDETVIVESKGGFSFLGFGSPTPAARVTSSSGAGSPSNRRKHEDEGTERQRKKLRVSVPGAFHTEQDGDDDHDQEPELPSPTSATIEKPQSKSSSRRTPPRSENNAGRNTRKRSASPEESSEANDTQITIPGALFKDDDEGEKPKQENGAANTSTHHGTTQRNGRVDEDSEEADELAPLPSHRNTRRRDAGASVSASNNLRTPRRTTRSVRGSSAEPDEPHGRAVPPPSTGRPVRRSSRLQSVEVSPSEEHFNKSELKKKDKEKEVRPKKSTRTTGAGATATGRGSSKRR